MLSGAAFAQGYPGPAMQSAPYTTTPLGYQQMTSLSAATALPSVPAKARYALVICTGQTIAWRDDGTAPTASVGMPLPINTPIVFAELPLSSVQIIQTASSAVCNVSYYQ